MWENAGWVNRLRDGLQGRDRPWPPLRLARMDGGSESVSVVWPTWSPKSRETQPASTRFGSATDVGVV
jgi:hypothetical protein